MRDNPLLTTLHTGGVAVASFLTIPDSFVAEVMGAAGVDVVVVDTEHSPMSSAQLQAVLAGLHPSESAVIVRVPANDDVYIKQALDLGAEGVLVPGVQSRLECETAVRSCRYAPQGARGFGPRRAARLHGDRADYLRRANDQVAVLAMIESVEAVDAVEEITDVDGLTAVFVGAADLAVSMGYLYELGNAAVIAAITRVADCCVRKGLPFGVFTGTEDAAHHWISLGAQIVTVGSDLQYLDAGIARTRNIRAVMVAQAEGVSPT
jgi:2-keto-3-deoxy-L-rhamnonate aldolase RhmA